MFVAKIRVMPKKGIADPQGLAVKSGLITMGFESVMDVRVGKYIEVVIKESNKEMAVEKVNEMCRKLLANPVIEDYFFEIVEG